MDESCGVTSSSPPRHLPRWSDVAPLVAFRRPELSPTRRRLANALTIDDLRTIARHRCPKAVFDYVDGAASEEISLRRSREVYAGLQFLPSVLHDVSEVDTSASVLGSRSEQPFAFAPTGFTRLMHHEGESAAARVAQRRGIPYALSTAGSSSIERIAELAPENAWFQLYILKSDQLNDDLIARADAAGYEVLLVTVDVPINARRLRNLRNNFALPLRYSPALAFDPR